MMKSPLLLLLLAVFGVVNVADAQVSEPIQSQSDVGDASPQVDESVPATSPLSEPNAAADLWRNIPVINGRGFNVGSPNAIKIGGGEGLRLGPPGMGVQYGGGQFVRYGTENIGVKYGGGEGVRYGTRNIGVQYGGGQLLRWGTPNTGLRIGGGEGARLGTRQFGVQFGTGFGLQIGRIRSAGN